MGEVGEGNDNLKLSLAKLVKDSTSDEESELVSLSLGISSTGQHEMKKKKNRNEKMRENEDLKDILALGLDIRFDSSAIKNLSTESSCDGERKDEELSETWPPSKVVKTIMRTRDKSEVSQHAELKKARVCIRARCDTLTVSINLLH